VLVVGIIIIRNGTIGCNSKERHRNEDGFWIGSLVLGVDDGGRCGMVRKGMVSKESTGLEDHLSFPVAWRLLLGKASNDLVWACFGSRPQKFSKPQPIQRPGLIMAPHATTAVAAHHGEVVPDFAFLLVDRTTLQASTTLTKSRDFFFDDTNDIMTIVHFYDGG
jgi:hypothetical protein